MSLYIIFGITTCLVNCTFKGKILNEESLPNLFSCPILFLKVVSLTDEPLLTLLRLTVSYDSINLCLPCKYIPYKK